MANVWFFTAADDGASWYRAEQPSMTLRWGGHSTWASTLVVPSIAAKADVVVASRPARPEALRVLEKVRERYGARIVADLDDDYWAMGPENTLAYQSWHLDDDGALLRGLEEGLRLADVVTVASEGIREAVLANAGVPDAKVHVVPNGLHASILGLPRDYERGFSNDGVLTIGWSGTASSIQGLDLAARAIGRAVTKYRDQVRVRLVGFSPQAASETVRKHLEVPGDIAHVEWVQHGDQYLSAVGAFDIWLAPYHNTAFNHAKFPTKALEAGFWGIPLVASDIRGYSDWYARTHQADHPKLVSEYTPHQWSQRLCELIESPELRRRHGEAGRSLAAAYSLQEVGRRWEAVLFG